MLLILKFQKSRKRLFCSFNRQLILIFILSRFKAVLNAFIELWLVIHLYIQYAYIAVKSLLKTIPAYIPAAYFIMPALFDRRSVLAAGQSSPFLTAGQLTAGQLSLCCLWNFPFLPACRLPSLFTFKKLAEKVPDFTFKKPVDFAFKKIFAKPLDFGQCIHYIVIDPLQRRKKHVND